MRVALCAGGSSSDWGVIDGRGAASGDATGATLGDPSGETCASPSGTGCDSWGSVAAPTADWLARSGLTETRRSLSVPYES